MSPAYQLVNYPLYVDTGRCIDTPPPTRDEQASDEQLRVEQGENRLIIPSGGQSRFTLDDCMSPRRTPLTTPADTRD